MLRRSIWSGLLVPFCDVTLIVPPATLEPWALLRTQPSVVAPFHSPRTRVVARRLAGSRTTAGTVAETARSVRDPSGSRTLSRCFVRGLGIARHGIRQRGE